MAVESYATQLERVQAAIAAVEANGQAYEIGSDGVTRRRQRADLAVLYAREERLRGLAARETNGGGRVRQTVPGF